MGMSLRWSGPGLTLASAQFLLLMASLRLGPGPGAGVAAGLLLLTSLFGWQRALRHGRLIGDTPTARVASAAQGYVELRGRGQPLNGTPLLSPFNGLPVLWYRVVTERRERDKWTHESTDESDASFLLDDGSGRVAVDPEGARMEVRRKEVHLRGDHRITQWCLLRHDPIYVLGQFITLGSISPDHDLAAGTRELLAQWKQDRPALLARFDANKDGEISLEEWEAARAAARQEVTTLRDQALAAAEAHVVRKPTDSRLYLISDLDPDKLARRFRLWSWYHLTLFLGSAAGLAWLANKGNLG